MEHIHDRGLSCREKEAYYFFEATSMQTLKGKKRVSVPLTWLPHAKYILSNLTLSALGFCRAPMVGQHIICLAAMALAFVYYVCLIALLTVFMFLLQAENI